MFSVVWALIITRGFMKGGEIISTFVLFNQLCGLFVKISYVIPVVVIY